ncbi:efflux RND transporter periplasmic adaptor subunit [Psychrobium sp. 1_MG-2023]|uniref:efflux RND transporter periplasmic adaptor subunit n=1 Tax=Psychrobium sp. 1_MG-2023 TaxID=3062624 RepID=UPI000C32F440|nr:efflux RND transporter periplasmic adaptor subunit [Psychrobium sp. 1_MG-2023]MDP2562256.1 efflux RND transporter periplasmic adaptor subunit [Psychrobium sp. 1_MG-2023]PKF57506.1 efflux RND transporter periplasmic adaptor subunit [Alteromonadales bacterium alter-6D02]
MATKKQIFLPLAALTVAVVAMAGLMMLKKPPEEKKVVEFIPLVKIEPVTVGELPLKVRSQGVVSPKEQTKLVSQINGQIIELAPQFIKGGLVKSGDLLARIDPSDYEANLIEAEANLASARASLQQEKAKGHVAEQEWLQITNAKPSELGLRKPQLAQEVARVRAAQAQVKKASRNLERTYIRAPYNAIVESRAVSLGSFVSVGSAVGHVLSTEVAQVRLPIADRDLQFLIAQGLNASVTIYAPFNGEKAQWQGKIVRNEGVIDNDSRMNYLVAEVDAPYSLAKPLRFGSYTTVDIEGYVLPSAAVVPRHLVIDNQLALLSADSTLHFANVKVIREQGNDVVITGDITNSSQYITSALDYPIEGMKLSLPEQLAEEKEQVKSEQMLAKVVGE